MPNIRAGKTSAAFKMKKSAGSATDIVMMFFFIMSMVVVLLAFYKCIGLMRVREDVSQVSRKYTLIAETEGYLSPENIRKLTDELTMLGLTNIDLGGTSVTEAGYGNIVMVMIKGKVDGLYDIRLERASTAKY